jgi:hypothetical protein
MISFSEPMWDHEASLPRASGLAEAERTILDFVKSCGERWNVHVVSLENAHDGEKRHGQYQCTV